MTATTTSTALLTDHYELTMVDAALADGTGWRPSVFEVFARRLPTGRRYGVVAGLDRVVDAIERFRFGDEELSWLSDRGFLSEATLDFLAGYRFAGDVEAYREGELFFPDSPILTVRAPFVEAVVLETVVLSILNHDSAIASAAARMVAAAGGRPLLEFGGRRTSEQAAVAAARAAYVAGFALTSNLEAGRRYGIPTSGTSAHAFTLLHDTEADAFRSQLTALGADTTLLVDTYDTAAGTSSAIELGGPALGSIRIDSGDLAAEAVRARRSLDGAGLGDTTIVASGDLDEYRLEELQDAPIDAYGVGTSVVTGSGHPTAGFVYKMVARSRTTDDHPAALEPVAKAGGRKATIGGRKRATRVLERGTATAERIEPWTVDAAEPTDGRALQVRVIVAGEVRHRPSLDDIRTAHRRAVDELPEHALRLDAGEPAIPTLRPEDPS
ncbi:MAG: nicotinate phosphoribosyltransferase [Actinobacteria bacterium]|nr:nicotinate phosphoribosyltransferase [Actinomycetota bacterium]